MSVTLPDDAQALQDIGAGGSPVNLSRRHFLTTSLGVTGGVLVLGFGIPVDAARAQAAPSADPARHIPAFLELGPDGTARLQSPFVEGGQGIFTAMAQIVGEEMDLDPARFIVAVAPAEPVYDIMPGVGRITGGSMSVRSSYETMRRIGAVARAMLLQAGSRRLGVPVAALTTQPGQVVDAASGRAVSYGDLTQAALDLTPPDPASVTLRDPSTFRWIGKPVSRLDVYDKSTGKAKFAIDMVVDDMLHAAVQHAPRLGLQPGQIRNADQVRAMKGVHSVHSLDGAVAVVAERWWTANRAVQTLVVDWQEPASMADLRYMPADFSTDAFSKGLAATKGPGKEAETKGNLEQGFRSASSYIRATYHSQYLHHAQLEPPSALAQFNGDGSLDVWLPNQAPGKYREDIAKRTGLPLEKVAVHSPMLGGFFGRHFLYEWGNPYPQAIELAKAVGRPVKLIWSREEEFLRDPMRPMAAVHFRGALDSDGMPIALEAVSATEGPSEGIANKHGPDLDPAALEGLTGKAYAIPHVRIAQNYVKNPVTLAYWRSVGNSMNDFFYETFLDELGDEGGQDPYQMRLDLLRGNARLTNLLHAVADLSGGWKRGPFTAADGTRRARGLAMASPFGSEAAAIAEVSIRGGQVQVHDVWEAIDPGSIVNPAIVAAQVNSAAALGLSQVLLEQVIYQDGLPQARNYDLYPILPPDRMPRIHVKVVQSGAKMGGVGEPPLPAVPPAVVNAVSQLVGRRIRSMPLSRHKLDT